MKKLCLVVLAIFAASLFVGYVASAKTIEEIMANVEAGAKKIKDVTGVQVLQFIIENEMVKATNKFQAKVPDKFRSETSIPIPGQKAVQQVITVCDGKTIWEYVPGPTKEDRKVIKMDLSKTAGELETYKKKLMETGFVGLSAEDILKVAEADYDIKVGKSVKLNGKEMDVIEGTLKPSAAKSAKTGAVNLPTPATISYLIGAKDGFIYKIEGKDKAGKTVLSISYENLKFNTGIKDTVFKFKPPKGVEVFDASEVAPHVVK